MIYDISPHCCGRLTAGEQEQLTARMYLRCEAASALSMDAPAAEPAAPTPAAQEPGEEEGDEELAGDMEAFEESWLDDDVSFVETLAER